MPPIETEKAAGNRLSVEDDEFDLGLLSLICTWGLYVEKSTYSVGNTDMSPRMEALGSVGGIN